MRNKPGTSGRGRLELPELCWQTDLTARATPGGSHLVDSARPAKGATQTNRPRRSATAGAASRGVDRPRSRGHGATGRDWQPGWWGIRRLQMSLKTAQCRDHRLVNAWLKRGGSSRCPVLRIIADRAGRLPCGGEVSEPLTSCAVPPSPEPPNSRATGTTGLVTSHRGPGGGVSAACTIRPTP